MDAVKKGLNYFNSYQQVITTAQVNGFIYFLRKVPYLGRKIPDAIFQNYELKRVFYLFMTLWRLFVGIGFKFVWLGVSFSLGGLVTNFLEGGFAQVGFLIWFFIFVLAKGITFGQQGISFGYGEWNFVENFQISKTFFFRSQEIINTFIHGLFYLPAGLVAGLIAGAPWSMMFAVFLSYTGFHLLFGYVSRVFAIAFSKVLNTVFTLVMMVGFLGLGAWILFFRESWGRNFFSPFVVFLYGIVLILGGVLLTGFKREKEYAIYWMEQLKEAQVIVKEASPLNINVKKSMTAETTQEFSHLRGNDYLNAMLFFRYRHTLRKGLLWRLGGITLLGVGGTAVSFFMGGILEIESLSALVATIPALLFIMYSVSFGKKIVEIAFVNCDFAMLNYPTYRQRDSILKGFLFRFKKTLFYNGIIGGAIFFFVSLIGSVSVGTLDLGFISLMALVIASFTVFLSFHELFLYYLLQPFTMDMKVKNPVYSVISNGLYWVFWLGMDIRLPSTWIAFAIAGISVLYVLVGLLVMIKKAPQTFRLKG